MNKKVLFAVFFLLTVVCDCASAAWTFVATSGKGEGFYTGYADFTTLRKTERMAKMWILFDYKNEQKIDDDNGRRYISITQQEEFDCHEEKTRILYFIINSENMGKGKMIDTESNSTNWIPNLPHSFDEIMWKLACKK